MYREETITINNNPVHTYHWGNTNHPTVILLHGLGSTGASFDDLAHLLEDVGRIIAIDLPGHGGSKTIQPLSLMTIASLIKEVIHYYGLSDVHLLGHSIGGTFALAVSTLLKAKSILLLDGGYLRSIDFPDYSLEDELEGTKSYYHGNKYETWKQFEESLRAEGLSQPLIELSKKQMIEVDDHIEIKLKQELAIEYIKETYDQPSDELLQNIDTEILLLNSTLPVEANRFRRQAIERMRRLVNLEVRAIDDSTHDIYWDQPHSVYRCIKAWIQKCS